MLYCELLQSRRDSKTNISDMIQSSPSKDKHSTNQDVIVSLQGEKRDFDQISTNISREELWLCTNGMY